MLHHFIFELLSPLHDTVILIAIKLPVFKYFLIMNNEIRYLRILLEIDFHLIFLNDFLNDFF